MKIENFEFWVDYIEDNLYFYFKSNPEIAAQADYTIDSLDFINNYIIKNYSHEKLKENKYEWEKLAMYIGQVFIKNIPNTEWILENRKKSVFYNLPIIQRKDVKDLIDCPHHMIMRVISKQTEGILKKIFFFMKDYTMDNSKHS